LTVLWPFVDGKLPGHWREDATEMRVWEVL
jgi:hypothetical protein